MFIDIEGLGALASDLDMADRRLSAVRSDAMATLVAIGQQADAAAVSTQLDSVVDTVGVVAASARVRAELAQDAEQTLIATLPSARLDARNAAWTLLFASQSAERDRAVGVDEAMVAMALALITEALRTDGTRLWFVSIGDTDVSESDLAAILAAMEGLNSAELQWLYWQLGEDERGKLLTEFYNGQGLDTRDRLRYLELLAGGLNPAQLLEQLELLGPDASELASAIGMYAPPPVAGQTMRAIGAGGEAGSIAIFSAIGAALDVQVLDDVLAVGYGVGWLFTMLDNSLVTSLDSIVSPMGGAVTIRYEYDSTATVALLAVVNRSTAVDIRADMWVAAVRMLEESLAAVAGGFESGLGYVASYSFKNGSEQAVAGLVSLLANQPLAMFDRLRLRADMFGDAASDFFRVVLRGDSEGISKDGAGVVNQIFGGLLGGDPATTTEFFLRQDPVVGGGRDYRNAARLGFAAATVSRGLSALEPSGDDAEAVLKLVLGIAAVVPAEVAPVIAGADFLVFINDQIARQQLEDLRADSTLFERLLMVAIVPRDLEGNRYEVDAVQEFEVSYSFVVGEGSRNGD